MKEKTVEIKITKTYKGKKLMSRWKVTTTTWTENGRTWTCSQQDVKNFQSIYFSGGSSDWIDITP